MNELVDDSVQFPFNARALSYSETFLRVCSEYPDLVLTHERSRRLLKRVADDPGHDKVSEDLMRSISAVIPYTSNSEEAKKWVLKSLYLAFIKHIETGDEKSRVWGIKRVGNMARLNLKPSLKAEVVGKFLKTWFSDDTCSESEIGKELQQQLLSLASGSLIDEVRIKAKDTDTNVKAKAEILLEKLKEYLSP